MLVFVTRSENKYEHYFLLTLPKMQRNIRGARTTLLSTLASILLGFGRVLVEALLCTACFFSAECDLVVSS